MKINNVSGVLHYIQGFCTRGSPGELYGQIRRGSLISVTTADGDTDAGTRGKWGTSHPEPEWIA